jgi:hypothetical protein
LIDVISIGVDKIQRNFEPLKTQINDWKACQLNDQTAKACIYDAFFDSGVNLPRTILLDVHRFYFEPEHDEFKPRTLWSLSNAFTSAFKELKPVKQFQATVKLGDFLEDYRMRKI